MATRRQLNDQSPSPSPSLSPLPPTSLYFRLLHTKKNTFPLFLASSTLLLYSPHPSICYLAMASLTFDTLLPATNWSRRVPFPYQPPSVPQCRHCQQPVRFTLIKSCLILWTRLRVKSESLGARSHPTSHYITLARLSDAKSSFVTLCPSSTLHTSPLWCT